MQDLHVMYTGLVIQIVSVRISILYSLSRLDQKTAKPHFGPRVKLPVA